ncbi:unnamed protein product [Cylindrotheca closterium]|uniref:Uncharacterized protein n=1 Tax=Cylindrotheca closterium TaxID=2856 RepID=A0AAD2FTD6_9STRA|nr:unnamed protein product [Cylindrotheca closterium]
MDFEAEVSEFDDLVQKMDSLRRQFPKECHRAILGLSELKDLGEAMGALIDTFGSDACVFALLVVQKNFGPHQGGNFVNIGSYKQQENEILDILARLYCNAKSFRGELRVKTEALPLSPIVQKAVTCTLQKNEQLKRETKGIGFVSCLCISNLLSNARVRELLDQFSFSGLFSELFLCINAFQYFGIVRHDEDDGEEASVEDIDRVLRILREGSVEVLRCSAGSVPVEFTRGLIDILKNGRIRKLHFESFSWNDVDDSVRHLCTGLKAYKQTIESEDNEIDGPGLEFVELKENNGLPGWRRGNACSIVKALEGISSLRHLRLLLDSETTNAVIQSLSKDLLLHPQCKLKELTLGGKGITADDSESSDAALAEFCEAIAHCGSIRALRISCLPFDISKLSVLFDHMASPGCLIEQFHVEWTGLAFTPDDIAVLAKSFENTNPKHSQPSRVRRISSHCGTTLVMNQERFRREERFRQNLQTNLTLLRDKLPYLISCEPFSYCSLRHHFPCDDNTPGFIISNFDIIQQIGLWEERNRCGRALLLESVAPTVPTGFWPTVLESADKKASILNDKGPSVDGIHYLVQGLIAANVISGDSWGSAEGRPQEATDLVQHRKEEGSRLKRQRTS